MPSAAPFPTIEAIVEAGSSSTRTASSIKRAATRRFGNNAAPLLLLTPLSLPEVPSLGKSACLTLLSGLHHFDLRLRSEEEDLVERAVDLYGSVEEVPLAALYVFVVSLGDARFTQYAPHPFLDTLQRHLPNMTLGELSQMNRYKLRLLLKEHGVTYIGKGARDYDAGIEMLRARLALYDLWLGLKASATQ